MTEIDRFYSTFYLFYNLQATVKGGHRDPPLPSIFGLQIIPQLVAQSILQLNEPFADVLRGLIGGGILIEIAAVLMGLSHYKAIRLDPFHIKRKLLIHPSSDVKNSLISFVERL